MNEFLWVEKYRPKTIEECILPKSTQKTFTEFLILVFTITFSPNAINRKRNSKNKKNINCQN